MNKEKDHDLYTIPPNFIGSSTFLGGMFKARNVIEAIILAVVIGVPVLFWIPVGVTAKVIILCLTALPGRGGEQLLLKVWVIALGGTALKLLWVTHPKWLSSVLYIGMGWLCLSELPNLLFALDRHGFWWLLAGGVFYTVGGVIYALKCKALNARHPNFGSHEIFHLFVLAGSVCQYVTMFYL